MEDRHKAGESRGNRCDLRRLKTQTEPHRNGHHRAKQRQGEEGKTKKKKKKTKNPTKQKLPHTHIHGEGDRESERGAAARRRRAAERRVLIRGRASMAEDGRLLDEHATLV